MRATDTVRSGVALLVVAAVLALLAAYAYVSEQSYRDEQLEIRHYCEMVAAGAWPAYRPETPCP